MMELKEMLKKSKKYLLIKRQEQPSCFFIPCYCFVMKTGSETTGLTSISKELTGSETTGLTDF
jgi:hypothetical protein